MKPFFTLLGQFFKRCQVFMQRELEATRNEPPYPFTYDEWEVFKRQRESATQPKFTQEQEQEMHEQLGLEHIDGQTRVS